jgi:hypothetical protein
MKRPEGLPRVNAGWHETGAPASKRHTLPSVLPDRTSRPVASHGINCARFDKCLLLNLRPRHRQHEMIIAQLAVICLIGLANPTALTVNPRASPCVKWAYDTSLRAGGR